MNEQELKIQAAKKAEYQSALREGTCIVEFTKVDGTKRVMKCTLDQSAIPEDKMPKPVVLKEGEVAKEPKPENPGIVRVFDLEKQEWRTFKLETVISFKAE